MQVQENIPRMQHKVCKYESRAYIVASIVGKWKVQEEIRDRSIKRVGKCSGRSENVA